MFKITYICCFFMFGFNLCQCFEDAWLAYQDSLRNAYREDLFVSLNENDEYIDLKEINNLLTAIRNFKRGKNYSMQNNILELVITNVTADENFKLNVNVRKWISLSIGPTCYSIGLTSTGLAVLFTQINGTNFGIKSAVRDLNKKPSDAIFLGSRSMNTMEVWVIVAFEDDLNLEWYKIHETELVLFCTWPLTHPVIHLNTFSVNNYQTLLLVKKYNNSTLVNLYQYELKQPCDFWIWQPLNVSGPVSSSAFNEFEFDSYISVAVKSLNKVIIFKHEDNRFVPYKSIRSTNVTTVVSFEIGFQSFLAIDGGNAAIYQFKRYDVVKEDIPNSILKWIDYWLPIPVKTYRDDVILMAQRNVDYTSHNDYIIEIFTYNGAVLEFSPDKSATPLIFLAKFEEHEDIPCTHFGEHAQWLTCLREGIKGSSYLAVEDKLGLIFPKPSINSSLLSMINFTVKETPNPMETQLKQLLHEKERLQKIIDAQMKEHENLMNISTKSETTDGKSHRDLLSRQSKMSFMDEIEAIAKSIEDVKEKVEKIKENENNTEFDVITINGTLEVKGEGKFKEIVVGRVNEEPVNELFEDIVSKDSIDKIFGNKTIHNLNVNHIIFEKVNGIDASEIIFNNGTTLRLTGNITIQGPAHIENINVSTGQVNDVNLDEIIDMTVDQEGTLKFEKVKVSNQFQTKFVNDKPLQTNETDLLNVDDTVKFNPEEDTVIIENLTVTNINGDDFDIFIKQLCLINLKCYIPGELKINGDIVTDKGKVKYLNNLKFPDEYIFRKPDRVTPNITGNKIFRNSLVAKEVKSHGNINGVDTKNLVTLSTNQQDISGKITFNDIEVAEQLNVTGKILGEHIEQFLPNPTLKYVNNISANVNFQNIVVDGIIVIENNLNKENFQNLLNDLVYKDETEVNILSQKEFPKGFTVKENLKIGSKSINGINLDSIVTRDTDQVLNITFLNGDVIMDNVKIEGKFNGQNITQLDQSLVKITEEQTISSTLTFAEGLDVENFEVTQTLNNLKLEEYLYKSGQIAIDSEEIFREIEADNITVEGNYSGNISEFDINKFNERYLSLSKDQVIEKHYDIVVSSVDNLKTERINSENYDDFFSREKFGENILEMLNSGQLKIGDLYVNGILYIESLNSRKENDWLPHDILEDNNGEFKKNLTIEGNIYFNTLEINNLSSINWNWFNKQLILKEEVTTNLSALTHFRKGIKVAKLIETKKINGIPIDDILRKQGAQTISGPIIVKGDVIFKESANISENMNDVDIEDILNSLEIENDTYHRKGDIVFSRLPHITNLTVEGYINNKNITEHLSTVVHLDEDSTFEEEVLFKEPVHISGNLAVEENINEIDLAEVANQIVLTTKDCEIQGMVTFSESVIIKYNLSVEGSFHTDTLYGIDLNEWKNNAIFLDKGRLKGTYLLDDVVIQDTLIIKQLNDINMDSIIPLKTNQTIDYLEFGEVIPIKDIPVHGSVNGYNNLSDEFDLTVMADKDQRISTNVIFNDVILVRENLSARFINGQEVSKIVTTDTDQNLTASYNFKTQCKMDGDLHVEGLVDGINMTVWQHRNIKMNSPAIQDVYFDWNVAESIIFSDRVDGGGLISDLNLTKIMKEVEDRKQFKYKVEHGIIKDYKELCSDVSYLYEGLKKQIYKFKYFEELCTITFKNQIENVHHFHFKNKHYLLVSEDECSSQLLVFNNNAFEHLNTIDMGHVSQIVTVQEDTSIYLVSTDGKLGKDCSVNGTNVWSFNGTTIELYYNMEKQDMLQESRLPLTFYGLSKQGVIEFKIRYNNPRKVRKWKVFEENVAFVPRGLKTGLSLRTGHKIIYLDQSDPIVDDFDVDLESTKIGNTSEILNTFIPGSKEGDLVVTKVGTTSTKRNFLAVATHEETSVRGRLDFVKIYSDAFKGTIFHKVPAYKPSSLLSVEFDQGETLLVFLENEKDIQVYEYKGIEGFKHRSSAKVQGSKLFLMSLPIKPYLNPRKVIGIIHKNKISIIQSVMAGNQIRDDLKCVL